MLKQYYSTQGLSLYEQQQLYTKLMNLNKEFYNPDNEFSLNKFKETIDKQIDNENKIELNKVKDIYNKWKSRIGKYFILKNKKNKIVCGYIITEIEEKIHKNTTNYEDEYFDDVLYNFTIYSMMFQILEKRILKNNHWGLPYDVMEQTERVSKEQFEKIFPLDKVENV